MCQPKSLQVVPAFAYAIFPNQTSGQNITSCVNSASIASGTNWGGSGQHNHGFEQRSVDNYCNERYDNQQSTGLNSYPAPKPATCFLLRISGNTQQVAYVCHVSQWQMKSWLKRKQKYIYYKLIMLFCLYLWNIVKRWTVSNFSLRNLQQYQPFLVNFHFAYM